MQKNLKKYFPIFVLPTLIAFSIAFLIPFIMGILLSFTEFNTISNAKWVGLSNYQKVFAEGSGFLNALVFTSKFTIASVISINLFAFIVALMLTKGIKGTNLFRTVFFMPNLIGGIVLGYIWQLIINGILINTMGVDITYDAAYGFWGLIVVMNWQLIGYMMIIYIAGIQNIPDELKESAQIDGASPFQTLT
ncbi:MAG: sugar ABC transporter permease, partial [Clostridiales bacterium]|nr:sugar ABC transporter permease [Clostridiales bacterium]